VGVTNLTVRYDGPSARRHPRVDAPAWVELDGGRYPTVDWSLGGFRVSGLPEEPRVGEPRAIRFFLNFQGFEIGFEAQARLHGVDPALAQAWGEFIDLGPREHDLLRHFVVGVATGEVSSVSDTLVHIDSPTSVANWGRAPSVGEGTLAGESWKKRGRLQRSLYFVAGPLLAGYALLAGYQSVFRMEIETAMVVRPTETVVAQGVGHLESMLVREGQTVSAGQPLFTAVDEDHGRDLDAKQQELARAELELKSAHASKLAAQEQMAIYLGIAHHKQKMASERVKALSIETESAQKNLARLESLVHQGLEPNSSLDAATAAFARVKGELNQALPDLDLANDAVHAAEQGSFYDGFRLIGELPEQTIREESAAARVHLAEQELASDPRGSGGRTIYSAPFPGRLVRITKSPGSTVDRGETLALIERVDAEPTIYALLTQDQVTRIRLGEGGTVRVPMLQKRFRAVVVRTDKVGAIPGRVVGDLLTNLARPRASDPAGYVEMELRSLTPAGRNALRSGMPAIVNLPRQPQGDASDGLSSWVR
jgi:multidrug resistance efflux pump